MRPHAGELREIAPDNIQRNPDNPRLVFREHEMQELVDSIREVGIQVPITVYQDQGAYILLDGERRWRCAKKLNLEAIPAIVQPRPSRLENILMMFNIHSVRVAWDPMPTAIKLGEVREMLASQGKPTTPAALAALTGMRPAAVRRCLDLLALPKKYQDALLEEAEKPRDQQRITADLFVEIFKSQRAIERYVPEVFDEIDRDTYVDAMVEKYLDRVVDNVVAYREISRIARAEKAGVDKSIAKPILVKLIKERNYSVHAAYEDSVKTAYERRDLLSATTSLARQLADMTRRRGLTRELSEALRTLREQINRLLGD